MNIIIVLKLLHKHFYEKIYNFKKGFHPIDMAKVDKRAAGHSTKHEIPVLISADAKMVDTVFLILCITHPSKELCSKMALGQVGVSLPCPSGSRLLTEWYKE